MLADEEDQNIIPQTFFEWLQDRCSEQKTSIGKLADQLEIPRTTLYWIAHNPRAMKTGFATRLGLALEVPAMDVLDAALNCELKAK